ncbi:MAG TPA: ATP-binding cassette domain-containing protein, partial [Candidatus Deferrimicrobiaceae bacterium]
MIEVFRLGIFARGATLCDGVDLAFPDGSVSVIAAPPSSGKTTLLSILRGERQPDAGDVVVSGESIFRGRGASFRSYRASCGYVPERFADPAGQTVEDLFRLCAVAVGGIPEGERRDRQERLLAMVGLASARYWRLSSLSASERVRAGLAAELLRGPRFLFGDGVVAAAGSPYRDMLGGLFRALAREGNTIVLAERRLPERWAAVAGEGTAAGPFRVYQVPVPSTATAI